jgi:hypothetical protein
LKHFAEYGGFGHAMDLSEDPDDTGLDETWQFIPETQLPEFCLADDPVDEHFLKEAKAEFRSVCANARRILNVSTHEEITLCDCVNFLF